MSPYERPDQGTVSGQDADDCGGGKIINAASECTRGAQKQSQRGTRPNTQLHKGGKIRENVGVSTIIFCPRLHAGGFGRLRWLAVHLWYVSKYRLVTYIHHMCSSTLSSLLCVLRPALDTRGSSLSMRVAAAGEHGEHGTAL